ncbi:MAG: aminomethyltransferase family protein [Acidobacteriia bacterium]|nr:aminomethyltransferase family protein [Terriglobia bacterium]
MSSNLRMATTSPLIDLEKSAGAKFVEVALPGPAGQSGAARIASAFSTLEEECRAVREAVGLMDLCQRGKIEITGPDRVRFLNGQVTNDVKKLAPGRGCYACALDYKGALVGDMKIYAHPDCLLMDTSEAASGKLLDHFIRFAISDEVEIMDKSPDIAHLALHGPAAPPLLNKLTGRDLSSLRHLEFTNELIAGGPVEVSRQDYLGEAGFDLITPSAHAGAVWQSCFAEGSAWGLRPVGYEAFNVLRIEAGTPIFGIDMTEEHLPLEANLMSAISTDKGCYTGQEVVARIMNRGHVNRLLCGLALEGSRIPSRGEKIFSGGKVVGEITSAAYSPTLHQVIALGYIPSTKSQPGERFYVGEADSSVSAVVAALPFYPGN